MGMIPTQGKPATGTMAKSLFSLAVVGSWSCVCACVWGDSGVKGSHSVQEQHLGANVNSVSLGWATWV